MRPSVTSSSCAWIDGFRCPVGLVTHARRTTDGNDTRASHGRKGSCACAAAEKLAPVLREQRARESRTRRSSGARPSAGGTGRSAPTPARCGGTRKRKRPTGKGWALNCGGGTRSRTRVRHMNRRQSASFQSRIWIIWPFPWTFVQTGLTPESRFLGAVLATSQHPHLRHGARRVLTTATHCATIRVSFV